MSFLYNDCAAVVAFDSHMENILTCVLIWCRKLSSIGGAVKLGVFQYQEPPPS